MLSLTVTGRNCNRIWRKENVHYV